MRVSHVVYHLGVGGGEQFLADLSVELARRGVRQSIHCVGPSGPLAEAPREAGVTIEALEKRSRLGASTVIALADRLRRDRCKVAHLHGEAGLVWGVPAAALAGVPACTLLYQNYEESPARMRVYGELARRARLLVAGSEDVRRFLVRRFGARPGRTLTIRCGLDLERFGGGRKKRRDGDPALVTVGRLVPRKGHETAIRALPRILETYPDARLHVVGDGPLEDSLRETAAQLGVAHAVELHGTVWPDTDVLRRADAMLFPSLEEPQGLVVVEAFAAGVPVVASDTGGIPEMVEHERSGLLVPPGDAEAIASAVLRLRGEARLGKRLVAGGRAAATRFDIRRVADRYEVVYDLLARDGRA